MTAPLTFGQKAVGLQFNPGSRSDVQEVKQAFADLIDRMDVLRNTTGSTAQARHASIAITMMEDCQMRAVKALTWED